MTPLAVFSRGRNKAAAPAALAPRAHRLRQLVRSFGAQAARWLSGASAYLATSRLALPYHRLRWGPLGTYIWWSRRIPTWTRGAEAIALSQVCYSLPEDAAIVEIGSFLGGGAVLMAGARKLRGSGKVYCVDPFDASGDAFSEPVYRAIRDTQHTPLRRRFEQNIRRAGLSQWAEARQGRSSDIAATWTTPIDLLFMDGDQSYAAVRTTYNDWSPFLKPGAILAVHNSRPGTHHASHDGHVRLVEEKIKPPHYAEIRLIGTTTFARKMAHEVLAGVDGVDGVD